MQQNEEQVKKIQEEAYSRYIKIREPIEKSISKIKKKIAVYSAKGGVGKTTIAINLAATLAKRGYKVCLLDADIDCPNVCELLAIREKVTVEQRIKPFEKYGMKIISMALFDENKEKARIWRGAILTNVLTEIVQKTDFGTLDYLILDLPPGTSDIPLTILQLFPIDGFILVTTPQKVAIADTIKAANMIKELNIKILGLIENMSGDPFGQETGEKAAKKLGIKFLGSVAINKKFPSLSDKGLVPVLEDKKLFENFSKIAEASVC